MFYNRVTLLTPSGREKDSFPYLARPRVVEMHGRRIKAEEKAKEIQGFMTDIGIRGRVETREWS